MTSSAYGYIAQFIQKQTGEINEREYEYMPLQSIALELNENLRWELINNDWVTDTEHYKVVVREGELV